MNFSFDSGNTPTDNKSPSTLQIEGWTTAAGVLAESHDAAQTQWGGGWRIPTYREFLQIRDNCKWTYTTTNGVTGYVVRGKDDYASASIFLPSAGSGNGTLLKSASSAGEYWSSTPPSNNDVCSWMFIFISSSRYAGTVNRYTGATVRPIHDYTAEYSGDSVSFSLDTLEGTRSAWMSVFLTYSTAWNGTTGLSIALDGETIFFAIAPASGDYTWDASTVMSGLHTLTFDDGVETLTATFAVVKGTLNVVCPYAGCDPAAGTNEYAWGSTVTASAPEYFIEGLVRHACTGWTGTGSVPASGTGTNVTFTLEEDSTLEWSIGAAEYRLELAVEGQGSLSADSGWFQQEATQVVTATPEQYWHFVAWEGDTAGCRITGTTLRAPMTQGRSIRAVFAPDVCSLAVENAFGAAWPTSGTSSVNKGSSVSAWNEDIIEEGRTRYLCTGWVGTGSAPMTGVGTNAVFTILEDSSLAWIWQTNYLVRVTVVGDGTTDIGEAWIEEGSNLVITATAGETAYTSAVWSGDINGAIIEGLSITIPVDRPRDIVMTFEALEMGNAVEQPSLAWTTDGPLTWIPVINGAHDGMDAAMAAAGGSGNYAEGTLSTVVEGGGDLSFWWKLDVASGSAGIDLLVDGEYSEEVWLVGATAWTQATVSLGKGNHTVEWSFWSDGGIATAWLDEASFTPDVIPLTETHTTPVHVPYAWLDGFGLGDGTEAGYETVAASMASNGVNRVWECYVAGLDPTNSASVLRTTIRFEGDAPVIEFDPPRPAHTPEEWYVVEGKETLNGSWAPKAEGHHFFRVRIAIPEN